MNDASDTFLPTRSSLLSRLRNSSDGVSWQQFFDDYGRLIHSICTRSGLGPQDAEEVTQETIVSISKKLPDFQYDRSAGSFKGWLWRVTKNHVCDFLRLKYRDGARRAILPDTATGEEPAMERFAQEDAAPDSAWDEEWRMHLLRRALARVRGMVSARSYQIFYLSTVRGRSVDQVKESLRIGRTQIYLARHRVGRLVKKELDALRKELE